MKRLPALQNLSREHHGALLLALRIARAVTEEEKEAMAKAVAEAFPAELEPHFREEESELLPRLAAAGEEALVRRTLEEHRRLRVLAQRIAAGESACLAAFGSELQAHVRFEERELFAVAENRLRADFLFKAA